MTGRGRRHPTSLVGWACPLLLAFSHAFGSGAAGDTAPDDPARLLARADSIKTADNPAFVDLIKRLDGEPERLKPGQREFLHYLQAWQLAYQGDYPAALRQLDTIAGNARDTTLRFRAGMTAVDVLGIAKRYGEAYARLSQEIDRLPLVTDPQARQQGLGVAAFLYGQAGQYDLELSYSSRLLAEEPQGIGTCTGSNHRLHALYLGGKLHEVGDEFTQAIDACVKAGEPIWANLIRVDAAALDLAQDRPDDAIAFLLPHYDETLRTRYPEVIEDVDSMLARSYAKTGDWARAQQYARHAVDNGISDGYTEAKAYAYEVLYQAAKRQGDAQGALAYLEKFAATDKAYLSDVSARTLAYQMVRQQVLEKKIQVDALSQQNQVLKLKQAVDRNNMIAVQLGIALLMVVLGSIALYAYRTKRSQLKFRKLARRDGLTEIFNRQYFVECAEQELAYCRKSVRDVSLVAIDLDHFKLINDTYGHAAGDFALKRAVEACQRHLRSVDIFGRLGGEEFGILLPDCVPEQAIDLAEKMRREIASLQGAEGGPEFAVTASFGVTAARWSGYDLLQLLAQADSALYQAKGEGRDRVVVRAGPPAANSGGLPGGIVDRRRA